jgi:hypothetical protein
VRRRHGAEFEYWDPSVEPALSETYGLPLYQEQIMAVFQHLGGYSASEADTVRRIMGKYYRIKGDVAARMLGAYEERFVETPRRSARAAARWPSASGTTAAAPRSTSSTRATPTSTA